MSLRQQKKQKAREDILTAAQLLISEQGLETARMRDIAAQAGVSYQTLYNYFPTKSRILQALLLANVEELLAGISAAVEGYRGDLLGTLRRINELCFAAIDAGDRALWRDATKDLVAEYQEAMGLFALVEADSHGSLELLLERAKEFGELNRDAPTTLVASTLFALIDYTFLRYLLDPDAQEAGALAELSAQLHLVLGQFLNP